MKLHEIKPLCESTELGGYVVYKVSSAASNHTYYGYAAGASENEIKRIFLSTANAADNSPGRQGRGVARWLRDHTENGGKIDSRDTNNIRGLDVEIETRAKSPEEAFELRNDYRVIDDMSITGPTYMPIEMWERVKRSDPQRAEWWRDSTRTRHRQSIADMSPEERAAYEGKIKERTARGNVTRATNKAAKEVAARAAKDATLPSWLRSDAPNQIRAVD